MCNRIELFYFFKRGKKGEEKRGNFNILLRLFKQLFLSVGEVSGTLYENTVEMIQRI